MRQHPTLAAAAVLLILGCGGGDSGGGGGPTTPLVTTGSVRGNVTDQSGAGIGGATVGMTATGQAARSTTTGSDGVYSFNAIPPGAYTIAVTPPAGFTIGSGTGTTTVTIVGGQQATASAIVLAKVTTGGGGNPNPQTVDVAMVNTSFSPPEVTINAGDRVRFTNRDNTAHNATGGGIATGDLNPNQSATATMPNTGRFNYSCTLHAGMNGTVVVR